MAYPRSKIPRPKGGGGLQAFAKTAWATGKPYRDAQKKAAGSLYGTVQRVYNRPKTYKSRRRTVGGGSSASTGGALVVRPTSEGITNSMIVIPHNPAKTAVELAKLYKEIGNKATINTLDTMGCQVISGRTSTQALSEVTQTYGLPDIRTLYQSLTSSTGAGTLAIDTVGSQSQKLLLQNCIQKTVFYNAANASAEVEIYDLLRKNDGTIGGSPITAWNAGLVAQNFNAVNAYQGGVSSVMPYSVPTTSRLFNETFKIVAKTKIELGPGRGHCHTVKHDTNRVIDTEDFELSTYKKGISYEQLIIARGTWADSNITGTIGNIGMTPPKIVGCVQKEYNARLVSNNFRTYTTKYSIPNLGVATLYIENDETAVAVSNQFA